jgi:hypothetical protein
MLLEKREVKSNFSGRNMDINEFKQQLTISIELLGVQVGDRDSKECIQHSIDRGSCKGCEFEAGCATYATVIHNMYVRQIKGKSVTEVDWDNEIQRQVAIAKAGIIPYLDTME